MRAIRALAVAALVALDVSAAAAQPGRHFKDSWFWGVKGGGTFYQVLSDPDGSLSPVAGVDWLITRTNGGLYVSFDQTIFNDKFVFVNDSVNPIDVTPGGRQVLLRHMRRFTMAGMLFPMQTYLMHPYIGFGATLSHIPYAEPLGTFASPTQQNLVLSTIQQFRSVALPIAMVGVQLRLLKFSAFGQATAIPASRNFFLFTGSGWRTSVEGGIRVNVGTSIDKMR